MTTRVRRKPVISAENSSDRRSSIRHAQQSVSLGQGTTGMQAPRLNVLSRWVNGRIRLALVTFSLLSILGSGCNYFILAGYLLGGPPSIEPDFDKMTKKSLRDKGVKVAVVCFAPDEVRLNFIDVDKDIAKYVSHRLNEHHIPTINPDRIQEWLEIGRAH